MSLLDRLPPFFDPRRRAGRQPYFAFHLAMVGILLLLVTFALAGPSLDISPDALLASPLLEPVGWIVSGLFTILGLLIAARRCHDIGWNGWASLLIMLPFLGTVFWLALFFIPGTRGPNAYGPDPRADYEPAA